MAMVFVISLPLILFSAMLGVGCYLFGRARGRQDIRTHAQTFGVPIAPPNAYPTDQPPSSCSKSKVSEMVGDEVSWLNDVVLLFDLGSWVGWID
ncbi:hypothetical protein HanRHA438_Chr16g0784261 [Helianthus annuus]|nr:hypothetical protein HanHA89_Chr16g0681941 [Helianthus annuus]KAJ0837999.1 hypothetical protein HanRHA438_Chr16g0784231 [Helianthus annuus]KAJ0838002.1 hypothetical protein HanRHA438_Chr16g0784261 [Helianthus annuus]